jgi:hypothetical protein
LATSRPARWLVAGALILALLVVAVLILLLVT